MCKLTCIIPAAGLSSRMGDFKPLMKLNNKTMIENTINSMLDAGVDRCIVILGHRGKEIEEIIKDKKNVICIYNYNYKNSDMLYSIKLGFNYINKLDNIDGSFVLPADIPLINSNTIRDLIKTFYIEKPKVIFPSYKKRQKHPPLISKECFKDIINFNEDGGLKNILSKYKKETFYMECDDFGCCLDADTNKQFNTLKKYNKIINQ